MEWLYVLWVIEQIRNVAGAINEIYKLYQNIDEFSRTPNWFNDPNGLQRKQFEYQIEQIMLNRELLLNACASILEAITQLKKTIFLSDMSDKLGDSDAALQALDNWTRTKIVGQRDIALNLSAGALADLLRYSNSGVYPNTSLVVTLFQILLVRLVVLTQADPSFNESSLARKPIEDSIKLIRSTANVIASEIDNKNKSNIDEEEIPEQREVRVLPASEGGGREVTITQASYYIHYQNVSASVIFERRLSGKNLTELAKQNLRRDCGIAISKGIEDDLTYYQIYSMLNIADMAEKILIHHEVYQLKEIFGRDLTLIERSEFRILRRSYTFSESIIRLMDKYIGEKDKHLNEKKVIKEYGEKILSRDMTDKETETMYSLAQTFGAKAVLMILLDYSNSNLRLADIDPPKIS